MGYTYVKAELDNDFISPQTGGLVAPAGSDLPAAPGSVLSLNFDKSWSLSGDMDLVVGVNGYYQSDVDNWISKDNDWSENWDSFWLLGASATLVADNWSAMLYIKNAGDEAGVSGGFPLSKANFDTGIFENWYGNGNRNFIVQPRTIGLKVGYRF